MALLQLLLLQAQPTIMVFIAILLLPPTDTIFMLTAQRQIVFPAMSKYLALAVLVIQRVQAALLLKEHPVLQA